MRKRGVIVGAGRAGAELHYGPLVAAGAEVVGFVEGNSELLEATMRRFNLARGFHSLQEAFAEGGPLDFVDICTGTRSHYPLALDAVERGCAVCIEKPITETLEELEALRAAREKSRLSICAIHNHKFYPGMVALRNRIRAGEAGDILAVHREMSFVHEKVRMMEEDHWSHGLPGGRLFEANPHNLYLLHGLVGEMELLDIRGQKRNDRWPHARIDEFTATLRAKRTHVTLHMSMNAESKWGKHGPNFIMVVGSKKTLYATYDRVLQLGGSWARKLGARGFLDRVKSLWGPPAPVDSDGNRINDGKGSGHFWMLDRFVGYLEGRYPEEPVPFEEAYHVQRLNLEMGRRIEKSLPRLSQA